jgi:hypothetical protein
VIAEEELEAMNDVIFHEQSDEAGATEAAMQAAA